MPRILIFSVALLLAAMPVPGADLFYMDHDAFTHEYIGPTGALVFSGEIIPGDYDRLLSKIADDENRFMEQNKLMLASEGGDVPEAIKIGKLVRSLYTEIVVGPLTGPCLGACFLIYTAANQRGTDGERLIGFDRPHILDSQRASLSPADVAMLEDKVLTQARAFLQENEVPNYLVEEMFRHAANDVYWLSAHDEANIGTKSPAFAQYLLAKCAWDDKIEREVYGGKRPLEDLKQMWACRARVTRSAAHQALALARREKSARDSNETKKGVAPR